MSPVKLSEKILTDAGGWQAMREARALVEARHVVSANYTPPILKGLVREGNTEYRAGLKISSPTDIENICGCRDSQQWGKICAHSLAVGLALIRAQSAPAPGTQQSAAPPPAGPSFSVPLDGSSNISLHIILPTAIQSAWEKDRVTVVFEVEHAGRTVLLQALSPDNAYLCRLEDYRVIHKIRELNDGTTAGMLILPREKLIELLTVMKGHPRVTSGRTVPVDVSALLASMAPGSLTDHGPGEPAGELPLMKPEFSLTIEGSLNYLGARLQAKYGKRILTAAVHGRAAEFPCRNLKAEENAISRLRESGFAGPDSSGQFILRSENHILAFFARDLPEFQKTWDVSIGSRFENITSEIERISPRIDIQSSGESWFDMTFSLAAPGGERFSSSEIQRLLQTGQNHVRLRSGKIAVFDSQILDEFQNVLLDCNPQQQQPGTYRVNRMHAGYLDAVIGEGTGAVFSGSSDWHKTSKMQRQLEKCQPVPLGALDDILRPYQKEGVYWMNFLSKKRLWGHSGG